ACLRYGRPAHRGHDGLLRSQGRILQARNALTSPRSRRGVPRPWRGLVARVFAAGLGERAGNGDEVLLPFMIKLAKGLGKKTHAVFRRCNAVNASGSRRCRWRTILRERNIL